jgi:hypothetical protein
MAHHRHNIPYPGQKSKLLALLTGDIAGETFTPGREEIGGGKRDVAASRQPFRNGLATAETPPTK